MDPKSPSPAELQPEAALTELAVLSREFAGSASGDALLTLGAERACRLSGAPAWVVLQVDTEGQLRWVASQGLHLPARPFPEGLFDETLAQELHALAVDPHEHCQLFPLVSSGSLFGAVGLLWSGTLPPLRRAAAEAVLDMTANALDRVVQTEELRRALADLHQSRRELARSEQLRTLGQLAAVVAHEVKNPIASISGALQVLQNRLGSGTMEQQIVAKLLTRLGELDELLNDLLVFARPREPRLRVQSVQPLLADAATALRNDPHFPDLTVEVGGDDASVQVDPAMMRQLLHNLLLNAAQAMEGQGTITLRAEAQPGRVLLMVQDQGPGVPPEVQARIFEPFYTSKIRGTGLGLAVCQRTAEAHDGALSFTCPPGGGTTFTLTLPRLDGS